MIPEVQSACEIPIGINGRSIHRRAAFYENILNIWFFFFYMEYGISLCVIKSDVSNFFFLGGGGDQNNVNNLWYLYKRS